jgi:Ca2+-binding RTX toxin-like protein
MATGLDFQRVTVTISNHFEGPNFVDGLAKQSGTYTVVTDKLARLEFAGGFDSAVTYVQLVMGEGFGIDANGRYTGFVTSYEAFEKENPQNGWSFQGLNTSLDRLNSLASDPQVTFEDLLVIPLVYEFNGAQFDDIFITGSFDDIALGFAGNDDFNGLSGADTLAGHSGSDTLFGEDGDDLLLGGDDGDLISGGSGADTVHGEHGNDTLFGGTGADLIQGGADADVVRGDAGSDDLRGGLGADTVHGGDGADSVSGGDGDDVLLGEGEGDTIDGGAGDDLLDGGAGTNFLFGQDGSDTLLGGDGSDELFGGAGSDRLSSGAGADFLIGGIGDDVLSGSTNGGATADKAVDTFIFEAAFGADVVTDFEIGFDGILLAGGITADDVTTTVSGGDVVVTVDFLGRQTILIQGVAARFNAQIDIQIA